MLRTSRQAPADAELVSHRLLLRAGMVQQLAAGIYSFLPLGWRAVQKIEQIVREEMDREGAQELNLPILQPIEVWETSGRNEAFGQTLFVFEDRREHRMALGPTHEEAVSVAAAGYIQSYRDLPFNVYQIQDKFRDEARPRAGVIRGREFRMKDAYSFDADWDGLDVTYRRMYDAYARIFERCGVPAISVLADSGAIGGKDSQEFIYLTEAGEDEILLCPDCGYAANAERAEFRIPPAAAEEPQAVTEVETPGVKTIEDLATFLDIAEAKTLKAVFYEADGEPVFVAIRGDLDVNEIKLKNALKAKELAVMAEDAVKRHGLVAGSAGPAGLKDIRVVADHSGVEAPNLVTGANRDGWHLMNVNHGRDWNADLIAEIALARTGSACINCGAGLETRRGVELGHVFKLGTVYSEAFDIRYLDQEGNPQPAVMGCYGIGTTRLLAAVIEANCDDKGIIWPAQVAPFQVHLVGLNLDRPEVRDKADGLYAVVKQAGLEVLYDDREESPGVKFNDADLLGMPVRLTIGPRSLERGGVELKARGSSDAEVVPVISCVAAVRALLV
jgi:prolyl-tRNA synthetase